MHDGLTDFALDLVLGTVELNKNNLWH
jgi:hypothetical protein